jgi:hypothetical protein
MKDRANRFRIEKINDRALLLTPENLKARTVSFMASEGWLQENKPIEGAEMDPQGRCVSGQTMAIG